MYVPYYKNIIKHAIIKFRVRECMELFIVKPIIITLLIRLKNLVLKQFLTTNLFYFLFFLL